MLAFEVLVRGRVAYEGPEGNTLCVPRGHCTVRSSDGAVRVSWCAEDGRCSAVLTAAYLEACLESGAMLIMDSAQIREQPERIGRN